MTTKTLYLLAFISLIFGAAVLFFFPSGMASVVIAAACVIFSLFLILKTKGGEK